MDLNDLRKDQTPENEAVTAAPDTASEEAAQNAVSPAAEEIQPGAESSAQTNTAPTPEKMRFPNPADYGWQSPRIPAPTQGYRSPQTGGAPVAPQNPVYPRPNAPYPPQGFPQGYPQQGYYPPQYTRTYPQNSVPYGYGQNPVPGYYYPPNVQTRTQAAAPQYPVKTKEKMLGGTKAVFAVIIALVIASLGFFVGYVIRDSRSGGNIPYVPNIPEWNLPIPGNPDESRPEESQPEETPSEPDASDPSEVSEPEESKPEYEVIPNTEGIKLNPLPDGEDLSAKQIYADIKNSLVGVIVEENTDSESQGSGIIATSDGYIVTNAHVVLNRRSVDVKIVTNDEKSYEAVVVGFDKTTDLAVLKIVGTADTFTPAAFGDSDTLSVGDWVLAIGNPGGQDFASSLTRGIVSAVNRKVGTNSASGMTYIQTDAAINPGNSGGALVNMAGQVVGINSSKIVASGYEGMGFAIPITKAKTIIDDLMANGYVVGRARLGIRGRNVTAYAATLGGIPQGFEIMEFPEGSPFLSVDAKIGDIITAIDGETVTSLTDITNVLARHTPGETIEISLYRYQNVSQPETVTVKITLLEDKGETQE